MTFIGDDSKKKLRNKRHIQRGLNAARILGGWHKESVLILGGMIVIIFFRENFSVRNAKQCVDEMIWSWGLFGVTWSMEDE